MSKASTTASYISGPALSQEAHASLGEAVREPPFLGPVIPHSLGTGILGEILLPALTSNTPPHSLRPVR